MKKLSGILYLACLVSCNAATFESPLTALNGIFAGGEGAYKESRKQVLFLLRQVPTTFGGISSQEGKNLATLDLQCFKSLSDWYDATDHEKDDIYARAILDYAILGSSIASEIVKISTGHKIGELDMEDTVILDAITEYVRPWGSPMIQLKKMIEQATLVASEWDGRGDTDQSTTEQLKLLVSAARLCDEQSLLEKVESKLLELGILDSDPHHEASCRINKKGRTYSAYSSEKDLEDLFLVGWFCKNLSSKNPKCHEQLAEILLITTRLFEREGNEKSPRRQTLKQILDILKGA